MNPQSVTGGTKSRRLFFIHLACGAALVLCACAFKWLHLSFWPCAFHRFTGYYCLTCGATRAVLLLLELRIAQSFLYNPLPLMLASFMLTLMGFALAGILRNRYYPFKWLPHVIIGMVGVLVVFFILRNFVGLPAPA